MVGHKKLAYVLLFFLFCGFLVWISPKAYKKAKSLRATSFVYQAEKAMAAGDKQLALERLLLAHKMAPTEEAVIRGFARHYFLENNSKNIFLWIELVNRNKNSTQDWEGLFYSAIKGENKRLAYRAIQGFKAAEPKNEKVKVLECRLLLEDKRYNLAVVVARSITDLSKINENDLLFVYEILLNGTGEEQKKSLIWLENEILKDDISGLSAAVILSRYNFKRGVFNQILIKRLQEHPLSSFEFKILAQSFIIQAMPSGNLEKRKAWEAFAEELNDKDRYYLVRWFLNNGRLDLAQGLIKDKEIFQTKSVAGIYVDILGAERKWEDLVLFLKDKKNPLDDFLIKLYLCRAYFELGQKELYELQWNLLLYTPRLSPDAFSYIANYAAVLGWDEKVKEVCKILMSNSQTKHLGSNALKMLEWRRAQSKENEKISGH
ncbi:MAG: hypothetical protein SH807_00520 [Blastochloris sp.]|nr:hypothetical protein [Blastochloris sp.]